MVIVCGYAFGFTTIVKELRSKSSRVVIFRFLFQQHMWAIECLIWLGIHFLPTKIHNCLCDCSFNVTFAHSNQRVANVRTFLSLLSPSLALSFRFLVCIHYSFRMHWQISKAVASIFCTTLFFTTLDNPKLKLNITHAHTQRLACWWCERIKNKCAIFI